MAKKLGGVTGKGFKPGVSGNPKGCSRIMEARQIAEEFGGYCDQKTGKTRDQHLMQVLYRRACQGVDAAARLYLAYRFGNPAQSIDLNASMKILKPEEHVENILATLSRLTGDATKSDDEPGRKRAN